MKNFSLTIIILLFLAVQLSAQTPNAISYQGVARNASGLVLPNQSIGLQFIVHQGSAGGAVVYKETQTTTTNLLGLFTVSIGTGAVVSGTFPGIPWGSSPEYLEVDMDPTGGTSYVTMGTNQFLSVPYALNSGSSNTSWNTSGNANTTGTNYIGTSDGNDLVFKANNSEVMRIANTTGNVGIGTSTPNAGAALDVSSTTKGMMIPRLSANPASASNGMMYYNTSTNCIMVYTNNYWDAVSCPCPNTPATPSQPVYAPTGLVNSSVCPTTAGLVFSVPAVSNATSYTWTITNGTINSGTGTNVISVTSATSSMTLKVAAVNNCATGTVSNTSTFPIVTVPSITGSPAANVFANTGNNATFSVTATNSPTYQWQVNTGVGGYTNITGATSSTYTASAVTLGMSGYLYHVLVSGPCSTLTSSASTLTVCSGNPSATGAIGGPASFCVSTSGLVFSVPTSTNATQYNWTVPAGNIIGAATNNTITVTSSATSGTYTITVAAANACTAASSSTYAVTNVATTAITTSPSNVAVPSTGTSTFSVAATGGSLGYQWYENSLAVTNGGVYSGATSSTLTLTNVTIGMNGNTYKVVVSGACGSSVTSGSGILSVCGGPLGSVSAISGPTGFCNGATGLVYSISPVTNATAYSWSVPSGAGTIVGGSTNNSITVTGSSGSGTISVTASTPCQSITQSLAVSAYSTTAITTQPVNATGSTSVNFTVGATGGSLGYQWYENAASAGFLPITNGGIYSGATTSILTLTNPTVGMNGNKYKVVVTGACGTTSVTSNGLATLTTCTGSPAVKITITNPATAATSANQSVQITGLNFNSYAGNEDPNLDNIEFTVGNTVSNGGTPLYAWIESGSAISSASATTPTSTSTAGIVWINLGSNVISGSSGTLVIYMNFLGTTVMTGTTGFTGEAPELSGIYGQYDNGALVFPTFYDNFAGNTLDANWTSYVNGTGSTITVNNGLSISVPVTPNLSNTVALITSASSSSPASFAPPFIADTYVTGSSAANGSRSYMPSLVGAPAGTGPQPNYISDSYTSNVGGQNPVSYVGFGNGRQASTEWSWNQDNASTSPSPYNDYDRYQTAPPAGYNVYGVVYNPTTNGLQLNYSVALATSSSTPSFSPTGSLYFALGLENNNTPSISTLNAYWARIRVYPPSGTEPTVAISALACF